jgi:hypothetical protein
MAFTNSAIVSVVSARTLRAGCIFSILSMLLMSFAAGAQQTAAPYSAPVSATAPAPAKATTPANASTAINTGGIASKSDVKPLWTELTPTQQQILGPLAPEWNKLDSNHKSKWLAISNKYPTMTPEKQQRFQANIHSFANLTPEQRRVARESYARAKKLEPEQKTAKWEQYQQLPEEQKQKLAADAAAKKRIANLPSLQNKAKTVEPLNASTASKKSSMNHNVPPSQSNNEHITLPANKATTPVSTTTTPASTPATVAPVAPATSK